MRKRFSIPLLVAIALTNPVNANIFGKYGSRYEADVACSKWMKKNQSKYYYCKNDLDTNQILGLDELSKVKKRFKS